MSDSSEASMKKHVMALTYEPKIEPVKDGRCTQTIRKGERVAVGDEILFHGWEGRPYRSKWNWQTRVVVTDVIKMEIYDTELLNGVHFPTTNPVSVFHWNHERINRLAKRDFIFPPTGEELKNVLLKLNGGKFLDNPIDEKYQIIRWRSKHER